MDIYNKKKYIGKLKKVKIYEPPEPIERREHGMDDVQVNGTLLCEEKQRKLMNNMNNIRISNEKYLREHPEINDIIGYFISNVLKNKPKDIDEYASELLSSDTLQNDVAKYKEEYLEIKELNKK
ncbi:hypothetical protein BCR36DRAFT_587990 [Piromyces finnis]|uniref:Uncharacterized protein n=1 Tax=Piromyces finnis TaxID=1754191 RepID=A0A1Y1UVJ1_9FUNG|nr:hypothetical protein BCR36DRAFT_587990 [Piromyces finnis]|eukprot:ORX41497.1 hypothetical protein BCR36DRAFT_587990 [Piromyces finnis]